MSSQRQIPKKNSNHSSLTTPAVNPLKSRGFGNGIQARSAALPRTNLLQTRPFGSPIQKSKQPKPTQSVSAQLKRTSEWGYNGLAIPVHAPGSSPSVQKQEGISELGNGFQSSVTPHANSGLNPLNHANVHRLKPAVQQISSPKQINRFLDDIWNTISDTAANVWDKVTDAASKRLNSSKPNNKTSDSLQLNVPVGEFTVTDPQAIIRQPPPSLTPEKGKPLIEKNSIVLIVDGVRKNGKDYVKVQYNSTSETQESSANLVWTAASNIQGLPAILLTMNPKPKKPEEDENENEDVVVPKPSRQTIPGLPEKPELEHPEFLAIVQEMEQMEQNPLLVEKEHKEEIGDERTDRVKKIAELRQRIAALGDTIADIDASQIKNAQAYLYRRLAPLAPYFGQMANTNILAKGDKKGEKGWDRTCNVTVPAMVLQGIGKTKADYDQSKLPLLKDIFEALEGKYKKRKIYAEATDFDALRLPDFMALIGIARWMSVGSQSLSEDEFVNAVSKARQTAAAKTTHHSTMMYLIEQFGGKHKKSGVYSSELNQIGEAQRDYTKAKLRNQNPEAWRELYNEVESGTKSFEQLSDKDKKRYKTIWKYEQLNKEKADELLPVDTYREAVLKKINPLLDKGAQILVGMENHFVRLDALDQDVIQVDDPGERGFKNLQVTWEEARNLGYFKGFWEITG